MIEVVIRDNTSKGKPPAFPELSLGVMLPSEIRTLIGLLKDDELPSYIGDDGYDEYIFNCAYLDLATGKYVIMFEKNS